MQLSNYDVVGELQRVMGDGGRKMFSLVPSMIRSVITQRAWADKFDMHGNPFASFEQFVTTPLWEGLESSIEELCGFCRKRPEIVELIRREVGAVAAHGTNQHAVGVDIVKSSEGGNAPTYALRRLKRDNPELAEEVMAGRLSAHAAAVQAGFRQATWSAPVDPGLLLIALARKYPNYIWPKVDSADFEQVPSDPSTDGGTP
jgi:hypothetical protein